MSNVDTILTVLFGSLVFLVAYRLLRGRMGSGVTGKPADSVDSCISRDVNAVEKLDPGIKSSTKHSDPSSDQEKGPVRPEKGDGVSEGYPPEEDGKQGQEARNQAPDATIQDPEARKHAPDTLIQDPKSRDQAPDTINQESGAMSQNPESRSQGAPAKSVVNAATFEGVGEAATVGGAGAAATSGGAGAAATSEGAGAAATSEGAGAAATSGGAEAAATSEDAGAAATSEGAGASATSEDAGAAAIARDAGVVDNAEGGVGLVETKIAADRGAATNGIPITERISAKDLTNERILALIGNFSSPKRERFRAVREAGERELHSAVQVLIEVLYEPEPAISAAAAESLGKLGDPQAIEPLLEVTRRNDIKIADSFPKGFGSKQALTSVPMADEQTDAPKQNNPFNYKEMTVFKIDLLPKEYFQADGTPIPRRELVLKGLKDNDQQLRKMAAKAAIGVQDPDLVPVLIETLKNPYEVESVRYLAAEALGEMREEKACEPLLDALKDENVAVRYSAASALSGIGGDTVVKGLVDALKDQNEFVRSQVAYALGRIADPKSLDALFGAVSDEHDAVRFSIAEALGKFPCGDVMTELEGRLSKADCGMRLALVEVLGQIKDDRAVEILRKVLRDPDSDMSFRASLALMEHKSLDAIDDLVEASRRLDRELMDWLAGSASGSSSAHQDTVSEQFKTFSTMNDRGGGEDQDAALGKLAVALQHTSPNVRGCAANALGDFRLPAATQLLLTALQDEQEYVRATALASLGKIGDANILPTLENYLKDPSEEVRYSMAKALGGFKDPRAAKFLQAMAVNDSSADVKRIARLGLENMG